MHVSTNGSTRDHVKQVRERKFFTTGRIAQMCGVAPRTVSKWIDTGKLVGHRIPGSKDRRVSRHNLLSFLDANGIAVDESRWSVYRRILLVGFAEAQAKALAAEFADRPEFKVDTANNTFEAGSQITEHLPEMVVIDTAIGRIEAGQIAATVKSNRITAKVCVVGYLDQSEADQSGRLGFDGCLIRGGSPHMLAFALGEIYDRFKGVIR